MAVRVKICGLTREQDVAAAVAAGADAVGFIVGFEYSPRNITIARAGELIRKVPPFVDSVLVTTSDLVSRLPSEVKLARPDVIQLYGDSSDPGEVRERFGVRLIRPYQLVTPDLEKARREAKGFDALLTDTYKKGRQGGTGETSDWALCQSIRSAIAPLPMVLSGGLNPENVAEAVRTVGPYAVDASSGVEGSPGLKDAGKVRDFVARAKGSEEEV
jgi:phosphoribosylanthranilate isomerase